MILHFVNVALANSWLLYRQDNVASDVPRKDIMSYLQFKKVVAIAFMARYDREDSDDMKDEPPKKRCKVVPEPDLSIRKISAKHLPEMMECKHAMRCRRNGVVENQELDAWHAMYIYVCKVT